MLRILSFFIVVLSISSFGVVRHVPGDYATIQKGIDAAVDGDVVIVAPGIYSGFGNCNLNFHNNYRITVRSENPNDPNVVENTVIDCNVSSGGFGFYNMADELTVSGFKIINGFCGIYCDQASPIISNCIISGHLRTSFNGAGIYCVTNSNPRIEGCIITGNSALAGSSSNGKGGGIFCQANSNPLIINCEISNNKANKGGAIYCDKSNPTISYCTISGNSASRGGGICFWRSDPEVSNCIVSGNHATDGGGFYNDESVPVFVNCIIKDNQAGEGGAIYGKYGGGIVNCTVINNKANRGGGIFCHNYSVFLVLNSILRGNIPDPIGNEDPTWVELTPVSYTNIQGGWSGDGNIDVDPLFVDPENNDFHLKSQAGRWDPNSLCWVEDDVTSPCIDAGAFSSPVGLEQFPNGGAVNMGAYGSTNEASKSYFNSTVCQTIMGGDINGDCKINIADFVILARSWQWEDSD